MPRKIDRVQGGEDEGEWIMSYADTVTLLLCFFVIFFSESKIGQDDEVTEVVEMSSTVEADQVLTFDEQVKEKKELERLAKLKTELESRLEKESLKDYELVQNRKDISIRLNEKGFFNRSSFKILPNGHEKLKKVALSLKNMQEDLMIHVEGHTDSTPVGSSSYYSSNLGLSSLRASNAAEVLISLGLSAEKIRAVGFGDARPVQVDRVTASETGKVTYSEDKASQNRRIEIRLLPQN